MYLKATSRKLHWSLNRITRDFILTILIYADGTLTLKVVIVNRVPLSGTSVQAISPAHNVASATKFFIIF